MTTENKPLTLREDILRSRAIAQHHTLAGYKLSTVTDVLGQGVVRVEAPPGYVYVILVNPAPSMGMPNVTAVMVHDTTVGKLEVDPTLEVKRPLGPKPQGKPSYPRGD
jgi:hypothetical protein